MEGDLPGRTLFSCSFQFFIVHGLTYLRIEDPSVENKMLERQYLYLYLISAAKDKEKNKEKKFKEFVRVKPKKKKKKKKKTKPGKFSPVLFSLGFLTISGEGVPRKDSLLEKRVSISDKNTDLRKSVFQSWELKGCHILFSKYLLA